ncbi:hypothetical protein KAR91_74485 [Candidatus Pacearchaeota archaeon]|nr:hypothetical protein [Candidatus Pacearchaeota archaeon]
MAVIRETSSGSNFLEKISTDADKAQITALQMYEKQLGSDGETANTVFTLDRAYIPGSKTLILYVNGQKATLEATPSDATEYSETGSYVVTFGASLQDTDVVEFMVIGSYAVTQADLDTILFNVRKDGSLVGTARTLDFKNANVVDEGGNIVSITPDVILSAAQSWTAAQTIQESTLTYGSTIDWDLETQQNTTVTLTGSPTMNAPSNLVAGKYVALRAVQDGTGGRAITWNAVYKGISSAVPDTSVDAINFYTFRCIDGTNLELVGFRSDVGA